MKTLVWLVLIVAVGFVVVKFVKPDLFDSLQGIAGSGGGASIVYKWQDEQGKWHVTDEPPAKGIQYTEQEYLHETNVVPAVQQDQK